MLQAKTAEKICRLIGICSSANLADDTLNVLAPKIVRIALTLDNSKANSNGRTMQLSNVKCSQINIVWIDGFS